MARNISPNSADTQRSKHSPWHLKKQSLLRSQVLTSEVNTTDTFITSWHSHPKPIFLLSHHPPTQQLKLSAVYAGETTTPKMLYAQAGSLKNRCSFKLRAFLGHWFFKVSQPLGVHGDDWLAAPAAQDPRGGDGACVVLGAMRRLLQGP